MTVTTPEAAAMVGRSPATIRWWVDEGYLRPLRPGARPLRFHEDDVWRCARDRMPAVETARLDALWGQVLTRTSDTP